MALSPAELARRRRVNRAEHYAAKRRAARAAGKPAAAAAAAWDHWRGLVAELPDQTAASFAEAITQTLDAHIAQITRILEGDQP
ncbi:hypothetical protein [Actinomadura sp. SCN-SB]|uniref:hypothetical protein n=1 Tax=Actinomadura sp. SCN-SB TaxID=3373092 RepID=UPI003751E521